MVTQQTSPDGDSGLARAAIEDVESDNQCSPPREFLISPKTGWMRGVEKAADVSLGFSMYLLYPAILIVICTDVIGRNFFETPLSWAIEGSGLFLIGAIFLAVPKVELDKNHILLDILYDIYPKRAKLVCDLLTRLLAGLWMLAATVRSSFEIPTAYMLNESGADFRYPFWPMRVIMTIGFLVLTLSLLYNVVDAYKQLRKGGQN